MRKKAPFKDNLTAYGFLSPYLLLFVLFLLLPAVSGIIISFFKWGIMGSPKFRGLKNYYKVFNDDLFIESLINTLYFTVMTAVPLVIIGLLLALFVNQKFKGKNITRTIIFLPHVISVSAVGIIWVWILDKNIGLLNYYFIEPFGFEPIGWLVQESTSMPAISIATIWWTVNVNMIIYLAGLQDIPEDLYEAAKIDGANKWNLLVHITIPMLKTVSIFVIPLTIIGCWKIFGQAYVMTNGGPGTSTYTIAQYIYSMGFQYFKMGQASVAGVILTLITLSFTLIQLKAMKAI